MNMYQSVLKTTALVVTLISCGLSFGMNEGFGVIGQKKINYEKIFRLQVRVLGAGLDNALITPSLKREESNLYSVRDIKQKTADKLHEKHKVTCSIDSIVFINAGRPLGNDEMVSKKQLTELTTNFAVIESISNSGTGRK